MSKLVNWRNSRKYNVEMDFSHVTDAVSEQFAADNRGVLYADLSNCKNITIETLNAVAYFCNTAVKIELYRCDLQGRPHRTH